MTRERILGFHYLWPRSGPAVTLKVVGDRTELCLVVEVYSESLQDQKT